MARISSYTADENIQKGDKLIGSDVTGQTKNYSIANVSQYFRETNASGAVAYFPYKLQQATGVAPDKGEAKATFSSGLTFANLTSIKMNKYVHKDTDNAINIALRVLNQKDVLIVEVDNHNNYGIYGVGDVTQDGSSDNYDLSCSYKSGNGTMVDGGVYAITAYPGGASTTHKHHQNNAATEWTVNHGFGLSDYLPNVTVKMSGGVTYANVQSMGIVTYVTANQLKINFLSAHSGYAYITK